ncbi:hypothetical protein BOTBODRAFT_37053 [Botryobasidium botryosum FD-172 SS1]|uniref:Ricin B lectin domain-containing protein n=1 Tax=Botryobasidium botryosum (strain FD-172 SS1) TaxID=930990 RepID=A0A067MD24_BOTB1|nr:hypothetical protein BOTBODRAFT_37053 [Botryobasidium botryosum FD-172 SS1]
MSIPANSTTSYLQVNSPDNRILNVTVYDGKPTLCVNDGTSGTKWTITLLPQNQFVDGKMYYTLKADDNSYLCPAPAGAGINLQHRTDFAYPWYLDQVSGGAYRIVDNVSTLAVGILNVNGIQLVSCDKGLVFRLLPTQVPS